MPGSQPGKTLFDETLIVCTSEFGRTPYFNPFAGQITIVLLTLRSGQAAALRVAALSARPMNTARVHRDGLEAQAAAET